MNSISAYVTACADKVFDTFRLPVQFIEASVDGHFVKLRGRFNLKLQ